MNKNSKQTKTKKKSNNKTISATTALFILIIFILNHNHHLVIMLMNIFINIFIIITRVTPFMASLSLPSTRSVHFRVIRVQSSEFINTQLTPVTWRNVLTTFRPFFLLYSNYILILLSQPFLFHTLSSIHSIEQPLDVHQS